MRPGKSRGGIKLKKFLLLLVGLFSLGLILSNLSDLRNLSQDKGEVQRPKKPILRVGLVADSEGENDLLAKALDQAKGIGVNFVIGLGDWSTVGTVEQLAAAKKVFDDSKLPYFITSGDHDLWESRNKQSLRSSSLGKLGTAGLRGEDALVNFNQVFGKSSQVFDRENVYFVIVDNSDIYRGISQEDWTVLSNLGDLSNLRHQEPKLVFVFAHKTPFHPESAHVMGEDNPEVAKQAKQFLDLMEGKKVDGFFSGDMHFFAQYKSPGGNVKITTVGAINADRNSQGPRFSTVTVYNDYSWDVSDVEIR